jgi:hypothetical protein
LDAKITPARGYPGEVNKVICMKEDWCYFWKSFLTVSAMVDERTPPPTRRRRTPKINEPKDASALFTYTSFIKRTPKTTMSRARLVKTPNKNHNSSLFMVNYTFCILRELAASSGVMGTT